MKKCKTITTCDSCGKEIKEGDLKHDYFKECAIDFHLNEWRGGSMGGSEDDFDIHADLCYDCAHKLMDFLLDKMKLKEQ